MSKNDASSGSLIVVNTIRVEKESGGFDYRQGVKGGRSRDYFKNGKKHSENGFGGESIITPSDLILVTKNQSGKTSCVSVKEEFREFGFQKITEKRLEKIKKAMPRTVELEVDGPNVRVSQKSMREWIAGIS